MDTGFGVISPKIEDRLIFLETAADVVKFSFIVSKSISSLNLILCGKFRPSELLQDVCCVCRRRSYRNFVDTEEKCRTFFSSRRRLLYRLHLDLPQGRECSLKNVSKSFACSSSSNSQHITGIRISREFQSNVLSGLIEDALSVNKPKLKILEWILKMPYSQAPLFYNLNVETANKFVDCFYPGNLDSELFREFILQFNVPEWMEDYDRPEILEFLLHNARTFRNLSLEIYEDVDFVGYNLSFEHYHNIRSVLMYADAPTTDLYDESYLSRLQTYRPGVDENLIEDAAQFMDMERIRLMLQVIYIFTESDVTATIETASEVLRLLWRSIPDPYITFEELNRVFSPMFGKEDLEEIYDFYATAISELPECTEPRSLKHLCRTILRKWLCQNKIWIPDGIERMGLPKSLQSFLNLER